VVDGKKLVEGKLEKEVGNDEAVWNGKPVPKLLLRVVVAGTGAFTEPAVKPCRVEYPNPAPVRVFTGVVDQGARLACWKATEFGRTAFEAEGVM